MQGGFFSSYGTDHKADGCSFGNYRWDYQEICIELVNEDCEEAVTEDGCCVKGIVMPCCSALAHRSSLIHFWPNESRLTVAAFLCPGDPI